MRWGSFNGRTRSTDSGPPKNLVLCAIAQRRSLIILAAIFGIIVHAQSVRAQVYEGAVASIQDGEPIEQPLALSKAKAQARPRRRLGREGSRSPSGGRSAAFSAK